MKKLKNMLAENMRRFGTKNLNEANLEDLDNIGFGGPRDPKTGNLIAPDADQNNDGYPDETNQMEKTEKVAKSKQEWWSLVRADLSDWNLKNHEDDRMSIGDWIGEVGPNIHGWIAFKDRYGDWDASLTGYEDNEDEDDDDSW